MQSISKTSIELHTGSLRPSCAHSESAPTSHSPHPEAAPSKWCRAPAGGLLGNNTKSTSPYDTPNTPQTPVSRDFRAARYASQIVIRKLILRENGFLSDKPLKVADFEEYNKLPRIVKCHRTRVSPTVDIHKSEDGKASYGGLTTCGSVWTCPVCAAKIQQQRRVEIESAIQWATDNGLIPVLITKTFPHTEFQTISELIEKQAKAQKYFTSGKSWSSFRERVGFRGLIRSLEIMYGGNGWHPHYHELWFVSSDTDVIELSRYAKNRWEQSCSKAGLIPRGKLRAFRSHALDVKFNFDSADYLAKQDDDSYLKGMASEIALGNLKSSKKLIHPFQLAALAYEGYPGAKETFFEYMDALKGRAQVYWSRGLKKEVGLTDLSDIDISENDSLEIQKSEIICKLEHHAWTVINDNNARAYILSLAEVEGYDGIHKWLKNKGVGISPLGYG